MNRNEVWAPRTLYLIPALLFIGFMYPFVAEVTRHSNAREEARANAVPLLSANEIGKMRSDVVNMMQTGEVLTLEDYFRVISEVHYVEALYHRFEYDVSNGTNPEADKVHRLRASFMSLRNAVNHFRNEKDDLFRYAESREAVAQAREIGLTFDTMNPPGMAKVPESTAGAKFKRGYGLTALICAPLFFLIRLRRRGLRTLIDIPSITFFSLIWPYGIFKYPDDLTAKRQFRRFIRIISYGFSAAISLFAPQLATAQTKNVSSKKGTNETEEMVTTESGITFSESPSTQILPTIEFGDNTTLNVFGWSHYSFSESAPEELALRSFRTRIDVKHKKTNIFMDGDLVSEQFDLKELWVKYQASDRLSVQAGRFFLAGASASPAPFLQENVFGPNLPLNFFATGVQMEINPGGVWSYAFDLTGQSGFSLLDSDQFDGLQFSGRIEREIEGGFVRGAIQSTGDSVNLILDGAKDIGEKSHIRGALSRESKSGDVGGYLFFRRKILDRLGLYKQVEYTDDALSFVGGMDMLFGNHFTFAVDQNFSSGELGARLQLRF